MRITGRARAGIAFATLPIVLLAGCTAREHTQSRLDQLHDLVREFDADSVSEVLCEYESGEPGALTKATYTWILPEPGGFDAVEQRLRDLGFDVTRASDGISAIRDGAYVGVSPVPDADDAPDLEAGLALRGCDVPAQKAIFVTVAEDGTSDVGDTEEQ